MSKTAPPPAPPRLSGRRRLLSVAGGLAAASGLGWKALAAPPAVSQVGSFDKVKLSWNQNALCLVSSALGHDEGIFREYGLDTELINFAGSTDLLLEAIATGKADAGTGMILRWLKPLEQGFDVKLTAGIHAGCSYLVTARDRGINAVADLKGKTIGLADISGTNRNLYSIMAQNAGLDPEKDVTWRAYPEDLLAPVLARGEIDAYVAGDPMVYFQIKNSNGGLFVLASNATGPWEDRTCCVLGIGNHLIRGKRDVARRLTEAQLEAARRVYNDPAHAVEVALRYQPRRRDAARADTIAQLQSLPHHDQPVGDAFRAQVLTYAQELKRAGVLGRRTDPGRFTDRITENVLAPA